MDNLWLKVENIVSKGEIARFVQFLLLSLCFQKAICCRRRKASIWGKGLIHVYLIRWMVNLFTPIRRSVTPSAADDFWKHCDKRRNCSKRAISPICHNVFQLLSVIIRTLIEIFHFFSGHFQRRLLQICCMWKG